MIPAAVAARLAVPSILYRIKWNLLAVAGNHTEFCAREQNADRKIDGVRCLSQATPLNKNGYDTEVRVRLLFSLPEGETTAITSGLFVVASPNVGRKQIAPVYQV